MIVDEFPDRKVQINGVDFLYFGGTNYLGMTTNAEFQNILFESIKKWGTSFGSSRNSNIKLSIYTIAENLLAENLNTEAALTVSSGMLAGKLVIETLSKTTDMLFHFPDTHPALMNATSNPIVENGKLNLKIFKSDIRKITILADAIPSLYIGPIDLSVLFEIPKEIEITLVIDESHSLGIFETNWKALFTNYQNIKIIVIASLGKAIGLSGGVIAGDKISIDTIRNENSFIGASGMNPAFLETYIHSQGIYESQKQKLRNNLNYLDSRFTNRNEFDFNAHYPVIYFDNARILESLYEKNIIITSFNYPTSSGKLNRIVINANHINEDLDALASVLNSNLL
jgi:7-keto-8-aminopelargonate synthetase-like enzyme